MVPKQALLIALLAGFCLSACSTTHRPSDGEDRIMYGTLAGAAVGAGIGAAAGGSVLPGALAGAAIGAIGAELTR